MGVYGRARKRLGGPLWRLSLFKSLTVHPFCFALVPFVSLKDSHGPRSIHCAYVE